MAGRFDALVAAAGLEGPDIAPVAVDTLAAVVVGVHLAAVVEAVAGIHLAAVDSPAEVVAGIRPDLGCLSGSPRQR